MSTQRLTEEQMRSIGTEALARELGATGLMRLLQMYEQGSSDYTRERADILPPRTAARIAEKIRDSRVAARKLRR